MALQRDAVALLSLVSDLVIVLDDDFQIRGANAAVERGLGYAAERLAGTPIASLIHPATLATWRSLVADLNGPASATSRAREVELKLVQCDGGDLPTVAALHRLEDAQGQTLVLIARDASERRKLRSEQNRAEVLEEANSALREAMLHAEQTTRVKSEFLANVSHEIRTPMTAILGFTEELLDQALSVSAPRETFDALQTIQRNGDYLLTLLNDILDLSKIESGRLELERVAYSPIAIVRDVARLMRVRAEAKGVPFQVAFATALPVRIEGDPTRVRQVLINLVGNGLKFTEVGSVCLRASLHEAAGSSRIVFEVTDTGIGISSAERSRLFRPFRQADGSTTRRYGGTGLGLTISKHLCELMDGSIEFESEPGRGTTVRVSLPTGSLEGIERTQPADDAADTPRSGVVRVAAPHLSGRVLLVEDGADNQRLIRLLLAKLGLEIVICENGQQGVERALEAREAGNAFDLILMDMQMPIMDGYTATRILRRRGYTGSIIALTAHAMHAERGRCLAAGCDDFATKPVDRESFFALLSEYLHAKEEV
ncbi:MAG: ATP-binding protein [Myxococcota bacterium]